jgi:NTE family protein
MDKALPIKTQPKRTQPMKTHKAAPRPPFECIALVLQGGGALGAYQAGVYQALAEADLHPDWVAGISIGAINSALIVGNPPAQRVERLRAFWEQITTPSAWGWGDDLVRSGAAARPARRPSWRGSASRRSAAADGRAAAAARR